MKYITDIKFIFYVCTDHQIIATDLERYPNVVEAICATVRPGRADQLSSILHLLWEWRAEIGFTLLTPNLIKAIKSKADSSSRGQTAYIPPRIWTYQVNRLREVLSDFLSNRDGIEKCYLHCLEIYSKHYNGLENAFTSNKRPPFSNPGPRAGEQQMARYAGPFSEIAKKYGIYDLLIKWLIKPGEIMDGMGRGVPTLSGFLTLVTYCGIGYILNFSMMRIKEAWDLRSSCFTTELDSSFGNIHIIQGATTKTIQDDDARWITSPSAKLAVDALSCIAKLRLVCAQQHPTLLVDPQDILDPWLVVRAYEPWANAVDLQKSTSVRPNYASYRSIIELYPKLFDCSEITITTSDLEIARQITPTLDESKYATGKFWPFSWHQLRRTGAVNMQESDLVSDPSMQYQLKHATRAMSLYYGKGYSALRLNKSARSEFLSTMYEMLSAKICSLESDRFISMTSPARKESIIQPIRMLDLKSIEKAVKKGEISWRPTLLGGCTKSGFCPYGGIDNIIRCAGGDGRGPCVDGIIDIDKRDKLSSLSQFLAKRIDQSSSRSPLYESLKQQYAALQYALEAIEQTHEQTKR
ncbi:MULTISPECIES: hypothetical protein [Pseudomonas]|uniref:Uncharacterized protein n=2 Tax=Pseudomonas TaxID=286 RepID=A0A7W2QBG6_9PSED|nr:MULTISPECIES: hypothetical protein [Pseudomonas]MBA6100318.1 hypothetical protein [Pseudomonas juntendi]MBA6118286.1 hypothetical protein [Pseudomonas putida]